MPVKDEPGKVLVLAVDVVDTVASVVGSGTHAGSVACEEFHQPSRLFGRPTFRRCDERPRARGLAAVIVSVSWRRFHGEHHIGSQLPERHERVPAHRGEHVRAAGLLEPVGVVQHQPPGPPDHGVGGMLEVNDPR